MEVKEIHDVQLKELIDTLHRDGVDKGRQESEALIRQAQAQAQQIIAAAQAQADALLENARKERSKMEQSGRESLKQASRDLLLQVRKQLEGLFAVLLKEKAQRALTDAEITGAIANMISSWKPEHQRNIELLLPDDSFDLLARALRKSLADRIAAGIEIKASPELVSGFRVSEKDGRAYYDFSAESIAESLSSYLNPGMAEILSQALRQSQ